MPTLTSQFIEDAIKDKIWDLGNKVLYQLCSTHPKHDRDDVVIAKVWIIGRTYAAAIERRPRVDRLERADALGSDDFYRHQVAPAFRVVDAWFASFETQELGTLQLHGKLVNLLKDVSRLAKRSFASKYLHFHFPSDFYIYDTNAESASRDVLRSFGAKPSPLTFESNIDLDYAGFFKRCEKISLLITEFIGRHPTPREVDKVLLRWSAYTLKERAARDD